MRIDRPRQAAAEMLGSFPAFQLSSFCGSLGRSVLLPPGGSLPLPLLGDPDADILALAAASFVLSLVLSPLLRSSRFTECSSMVDTHYVSRTVLMNKIF